MIVRRPGKPRRSRLISLVAGVLVGLVVAACGLPHQSKENIEAMDAVAAEIQQTLQQRPDITKADVGYQNNLNAPGSVSVKLFVTPDADVDAVVDEAIRLVWTSELNPLESITVGVTDLNDHSRSTTKYVDAAQPDVKAELERRYGPRPTG